MCWLVGLMAYWLYDGLVLWHVVWRTVVFVDGVIGSVVVFVSGWLSCWLVVCDMLTAGWLDRWLVGLLVAWLYCWLTGLLTGPMKR